jgi:hypothetical protein
MTKDYESYMEFCSLEDFLSDKFVNLQLPYYFIPITEKQTSNNCTENLTKHAKEKEEFCSKYFNKFGDNTQTQQKTMVQSNSYKHEKGKIKK